MAFRIVWLLPVLVAVSSSPLYSRSLVQTPTSSSEQFLLISPEVQSSAYRIKPELIQPFSQFEFPKDQTVYYYPQPAGQQEPLNLYELRQEVPWYQNLWLQLVGGGESSEGSPEESPEESPVDTPEITNIASPQELPDLSMSPEELSELSMSPENLPELIMSPESPLFDEMQKIPPIDKDAEVFSNELAKTLPSHPIAAPAAEQPQAPQIYMHNEKYYVISGQPEFYGNFNALKKPVSPIFSLQQLAPIIRSDAKYDFKPTLIAPLPLPPLRSLAKSAPSEEEKPQEPIPANDEAAPQLRSQAPASEQNQVTEPEKEQQKENARREEEEESDKKEEGKKELFSQLVSVSIVYKKTFKNINQ